MSTGLITISVVVGIALIMGLFYISHSIEKQKAKRALMIANLSEKAHRIQRLIDRTPAAYLPKDLKVLLLNEIKKRYDKLIEIAPGNTKFKKNLESVTSQIADAQSSNSKAAAPQFKTPEEANEIKAALQELSKAVEAFVKTGTLQSSAGQKYLSQIQSAFVEANVNYTIGLGDTARRENKAKLAIHHYQKAMGELTKRNKSNAYSERIAQLKASIAELSSQEGITPQPEETGNGNELTKGLDDLIEDDNAWKKKYF